MSDGAAPITISAPFVAEAAHHGRHSLAIRYGCQDHFGAAQLAQFRGGVLRLAIDVAHGAQLAGQRLLVFPARDRHGPEPRSSGVLNAEMAQAAEAKYGDQIARSRAAVAKAVERRHAGAHERRRLHRRQLARHHGHSFGARDHVFGIAAVRGDAGDRGEGLAGEEIAAAAGIAVAAVSAVPADPDALPGLPPGDAGTDRVHYADYLVAGHTRVLNSGKPSLVRLSLWQMPQACTLIRTDPAPGSGISRSTISKGAFGRATCTARILDIAPETKWLGYTIQKIQQ